MNIFTPTLLMLIAFCLAGCGKTLEKNLLGKWAMERSISLDDEEMTGKLSMKCTSNYFPNKSVTHDCELIISGNSKANEDQKFAFAGTLRQIGEWSIVAQTVFDKTVDTKVDFSQLRVNDQLVTDQAFIDQFTKDMRSQFLVGETDASKTISIDEKKWVFESEVEKKMVTVTATRL